jgi:hypothetical protein
MLLSFPGFQLNKVNVMFLTFFYHCLGPNTCLNFANVCFAQEEHTQARLPDTPATGNVGKIPFIAKKM